MSLISLNYNEIGTLRIQLPQGPSDDSYKISIVVYVIDDANGQTVYKLNQQVQVCPNVSQTMNLICDMINMSTSASAAATASSRANAFMQQMMSENMQVTAQNVMTFTSVLNDMSTNVSYIIYK